MKALGTILILTILTENSIVNGRNWYFGEDQMDPLTGLTDDEKESVRSSWKYMMKDPSKYGSMILKNYFMKYPEYLKYFPFGNDTEEGLSSQKEFMVYLNLMMYALDSVVDNLRQDPTVMKAILKKIGKNHFKSNVHVVEPFWNLRDMLLDIIQPLVNKNTYNAWVKFSNMTMDHITSAMMEEKNNPRHDLR